MATALSLLNAANELAYLSGIFNWQMSDAKYITPDNKSTVSFHVVDALQVPAEQYIAGAVNAYDLVAGISSKDPNIRLFNTQMIAGGIRESISRKYTLNRVPFANYDQPVDLGVGSQKIVFNVLFAGTMYQTAMRNFVQYLFDNSVPGLGTLIHPFYDKILNVLPIEFNTIYNYESLNCVVCEVTFLTSDISHLDPTSIKTSISSQVSKYYIGIQNTITSLGGTISAASRLGTQFKASL